MRGVSVSAVKPLNTSLSATRTLEMPDALAIFSAAWEMIEILKLSKMAWLVCAQHWVKPEYNIMIDRAIYKYVCPLG